MNICFIHDLHLPILQDALQYKAFDWAIEDARKKEADLIVFTGTISLDKTGKAYTRFVDKMKGCGMPFEIANKEKNYGVDINSLQTIDPDEAVGESPCITFYDTETKQLRKMYYFCAVPTDLHEYIGVACHDAEQDLRFACENGIKKLELRAESLQMHTDVILQLIEKWRSKGGEKLLLHVSQINSDNAQEITKLCNRLRPDYVTIHIPPVSVTSVREDDKVLSDIASALAEQLNGIDGIITVGIENMHMATDETEQERLFGCLPEECVEFMKLLSLYCKHNVGITFDIGHARNNGVYSKKYSTSTWLAQIGKYIVGYRLYQVTEKDGIIKNHMSITDVHGEKISFGAFFRSWAEGFIPKAPIVFDIRESGGIRTTLDTFNQYKSKKIFDLHSHTYYSNCGRDNPHSLIDAAVMNGVSILGLTDHNYGIADRKEKYFEEVKALKKEYDGRIKILCGIELSTLPHLYDLKKPNEIINYDYCLLEHILEPESIVGNDLFGFAKKHVITCGIAHTDMFEYCDRFGYEYNEFFKRMAECGMFWEMNVTYDSIHRYREHGYVADFMQDNNKVEIIKNAGVCISIGSDSHRYEDYYGFKIHQMYDFLKTNNVRTADELF